MVLFTYKTSNCGPSINLFPMTHNQPFYANWSEKNVFYMRESIIKDNM